MDRRNPPPPRGEFLLACFDIKKHWGWCCWRVVIQRSENISISGIWITPPFGGWGSTTNLSCTCMQRMHMGTSLEKCLAQVFYLRNSTGTMGLIHRNVYSAYKYVQRCVCSYVIKCIWQFPLKVLHPPNPPNRESLHFSVSCGTNVNWDFDWIWICTEKFEFLDLEDCGGVAFPAETITWMCIAPINI